MHFKCGKTKPLSQFAKTMPEQ